MMRLFNNQYWHQIAVLDSLTVFIISLFVYSQKGYFWIPLFFTFFNVIMLIVINKKYQKQFIIYHILGKSHTNFVDQYLKWHFYNLLISYLISTVMYLILHLAKDIDIRLILIFLLWVLIMFTINIWIYAISIGRIL